MYTRESVAYALGFTLMFLVGAGGLIAGFWRRKPPDEDTRRWHKHYQQVRHATREALQTQQAADAGLRDLTHQNQTEPGRGSR